MSDELRECPFCGGTETMAIWDGQKAAITCACSGTGPYMWMDARREAEGRQSDVVDDCTTMWNTRPVEDALRAEVLRLNAQYYEMETYGCPDCNGDGEIKGNTCFTCNGHGVLYVKPNEAAE